MMKIKHTPLPWSISKWKAYILDKKRDIIVTIGNTVKSDKENIANADFIVRACNSHYKLLEALKLSKALIWELKNGIKSTLPIEEKEETIEQAIKNAEGEE